MTSPNEIIARFRDLGARLVAPSAQTRDRDATWDRGLVRELASRGLFRQRSTEDRAAAVLGLAIGSLDLGVAVSACAHLTAIEAIERFGSPEQRSTLLPRLVDGDMLCAVANAEPQAGTDVMALRSRAVPQGDGYALTAIKRSITNLGAADLALVSARIEGVPADQAINVFVVDTTGPRTFVRPATDLAALRTSPTGALVCRGAPLRSDALLGPLGSGVAIFRTMFSFERLYTGQLYLAAIRACLERALEHAETRIQFGKPIGQHQYVQGKIVDMKIADELLSAHLASVGQRLVANAASGGVAASEGNNVFGSLSVVKAYGIEAAITAARDLIALLGQRGLSRDELAERLLRDLLGLSILGGTVELQKIVIYSEAAKARTTSSAGNAAPAGVELRVVETSALTEPETRRLVALVARAFPDQPLLGDRWYYDTLPAFVILAERAGALVGFRAIVERTVALGDRTVKIAGIGIAVEPEHQRTGIGTALTGRLIAELDARGFDLALAFLFAPTAERLLRSYGFRPLAARVRYTDRATGNAVTEGMACFARGACCDDIDARGELDLGVGTW